MSGRLTYEYLDAQRALIGDSALAAAYFAAGVILMDAERSFLGNVRGLARSMTDLAERVEHGSVPNPLGEVQWLGSAVDASAGMLHACRDAFERIERLAGFGEVSA